MTWSDLLFMHWPVPVAALRAHVPAALEIDTFTGGGFVEQAFIGVVPFRMSGTRLRGTPAIPGVSAFPELNVRTYVRGAPPKGRERAEPRGRPGVWFFSLDAASRVAVEVARATFHLPYLYARMSCESERGEGGGGGEGGGEGWVAYASTRRDRRGGGGEGGGAEFRARYRGTGPVMRAAPGTLDHFLTERYCLYAADRRGRVYRGEIHHRPWPLRPAEAVVERSTMAEPLGVSLGREGAWPLLHFAERLEVRGWAPGRVRG